MNNIILNNKTSRSLLIILFYSVVNLCFAEIPSQANYSTATSNNCKDYECKKSLYPSETIDIKRKNLSRSQFEAIIEKHINAIQTTQTTYPGFSSTVKRKIPNDLKNKALHCHKAKAQKINWNNSKQRTTTVKYRHQCWQLKTSHNKSGSHLHQKVERINDIIYTIEISRTATACSSDQYSPHPTNFECVDNFQRYSLLTLEQSADADFIKIELDGNELNFVLLDVTENLIPDSLSGGPEIEAILPDDGNNGLIPIDEPELIDNDTEQEQQQAALDDEDEPAQDSKESNKIEID